MTMLDQDDPIGSRLNRGQALSIGAILALAFALRLYQLGAESLWIDEGFSLRDAISLNVMAETRPLYFLILAGWLKLGPGNSEFLLRLPSVLFGAAAVWVFYAVGRRLLGASTAALASFFMAVSVLHINHSQEVRMYSLVVLTSLLSTHFLLRGLERAQLRYALGYGLFAIATLLTFPLTALLFAAHGLFLVLYIRRYRRASIQLLGVQLGMAAAWVPWFINNIHASAGYAQGYAATIPRPTALGLVTFLGKFFLWKWSDPGGPLAWGCTLFSILLGMLALYGLTKLRRSSAHEAFVWIWLAVPAVGLMSMCYALSNMWMVHYLIFVSPAFFLIVAHALTSMTEKRMAMAALLAISVVTLGRLAVYYARPARAEWRPAVRYIQEHERPGDVIGLYYAGNKFVFDYYYTGVSDWAPLGETAVAKEDFGSWDEQKVERLFKQFPTVGRRFWLVLSHHTYRGGFHIVNYVKKSYRIIDHRGYHLLEIYMFDAHGTPVPTAAHVDSQPPQEMISSSWQRTRTRDMNSNTR